MTDERDYLAEIAAWMVECKCVVVGTTKICVACKGSTLVLDPRFEGLRGEMHDMTTPKHHGYDGSLPLGSGKKSCEMAECPGYTVIPDLAILFRCAKKVSDECWNKAVAALSNEPTRDDVKDVAKAVYEHLVAESKE